MVKVMISSSVDSGSATDGRSAICDGNRNGKSFCDCERKTVAGGIYM
jgi:hypothetical protein